MEEAKARIYTGSLFGFFQTLMMAFAMVIPTFYFNSLGLSLAVYAVLLSVGDVVSFLMKPVLGVLTDRHGERRFLMAGGVVFVVTLFLVGQTTDLLSIALLKIVAGVASALVFVLILIYSLRLVKESPDRKIGAFGGVYNLGWVAGLLIPGVFISAVSVQAAFYLILVVGVVWVVLMLRFARRYDSSVSVRFSFTHLKKIPSYIVLKSLDLAMFSAFVFYFTRYALNDLGISPRTTSFIVVVEVIFFAASMFLIGRFSTPRLRKFWVPLCILFHLLAASTMVLAVARTELVLFFLVAILIGIAGGFIDIWVYSRISEHFDVQEKGLVIGTLGWSYDLATIFGANVPVLMVLIGTQTFSALFVFPIVMAITYLLFTRASSKTHQTH